jgi:hypothetical protein
MRFVLLTLLFALLTSAGALAQTGKIAGQVTDAATGDPLPGVNVLVQDTQRGAVTNLDGRYDVLNVSPGTYTVRVSMLGYATHFIENVRVNIDQTTTINVEMQEEVFGLGEVVVRAERPVVQRDVSNTRVNVSAAEIEALPATSISEVVTLQAGIQDGLVVRGNDATQLAFMVNGLTLRDERDNRPHTNISICSIQEVQVQTGGFNAEYGNVRSGVVNVVSREGSPDSYDGCTMLRYRAPGPKNFDQLPNDPDSYWIRPFIDPDVAFVGTERGGWDDVTRSQYPEWHGWIAESEARMADGDPSTDMTPDALYQAFLWQHRKAMNITAPDYDVDIGFGGPVPGISQRLGNLRFFGAYKRGEEMYMIPLNTDRYEEQTGHLKLTSDVASGMKLSVEGRLSDAHGTTSDRFGQPGIFRSSGSIANQLSPVTGSGVGFIDTRIFATDYWAPSTVRSNQLGATFTHMLNPATYYEVRLNRFESRYNTNPGPLRDTTAIAFFGGVGFDQAPFGFEPRPTFAVNGMRTGVGMSNARDTSRVSNYNVKADLTSQLNPIVMVKTGFEYNLTDSRVNYGQFDAFLPASNSISSWTETPTRGAAYAQTTLDFRGMIANLGLRADYFHAGGNWYDFDPFDRAFRARENPLEALDTLLTRTPTARILSLSPRLGVSFPVTDDSKLFFNYGHFRSMPDPNNLFLIRYFTSTGQISRIASPNNPLPRTIAYEAGFEQSILGQFLIRAAGYYRDIALEPRLVTYMSRDGSVEYSVSEPNRYGDIRGFELTLERNRGDWVRGFINYTYMVYTEGFFGLRQFDENTTRQRAFEESDAERRAASTRPEPRPYARAHLNFFTPRDFGPNLSGIRPLADWRASVVGQWRDGGRYTWAGGGSVPGVHRNVDRVDFWNLDLRFSRTFPIQDRSLTFFADVFNVTNRRQMSFAGFIDGTDRDNYLGSLHLPDSPDYGNIVGNDKVGTFRHPRVDFQPMRGISSTNVFTDENRPSPNVIYRDYSSDRWIVYDNGTWRDADPARVQEVLSTRAYIDMPNQAFLTFLNPRDIRFGLRLNF